MRVNHHSSVAKQLRTLAVLISLAAPMEYLAAATQNNNQIEETVVVASRVQTPQDTLGLSVSTIDRRDLTLLGYVTLDDILDLQPGVTVANTGGYGKSATVRIRGEEGFRTRIQLDGIDIADPSSPQISPRVEHLLTEGIARVEILRGPQGLMYGADGGGVVAITTRRPAAGFSADLSAESGSNGFYRYGASLAGGNDHVSASLSISDVQTEGFNARTLDAVKPDQDGYDNSTIHATGVISLTDQWQAGVSGHLVDGKNDYDGCYDVSTFALINDCRDNYQQAAWRTYATWQGDNTSITASFEENRIERQFLSAGIESFATDGKHQELSIIGNRALTNGQRLTLGVDRLNLSLTDSGNLRQRNNTGIYGEYALPLLHGNVQVGIRHDDNDDFGRHTSWRLSTYQPLGDQASDVALTAAIGTGFRAPSLYEISYNQGPFAFAPASTTALDAETSEGWEIGLQWGAQDRWLRLTYFDQSLENEIYFDLNTYAGYLQRLGRSQSTGVELEAKMALTQNWYVSANTTWNKTEDINGQQRPYRPELSAAASLQWRSAIFEGALTVRHAQDSVDTLGLPMDDFSLIDIAASAQLAEGLSLTARVENMSNKKYQQITGYYSNPRAAFIGIRYQY